MMGELTKKLGMSKTSFRTPTHVVGVHYIYVTLVEYCPHCPMVNRHECKVGQHHLHCVPGNLLQPSSRYLLWMSVIRTFTV